MHFGAINSFHASSALRTTLTVDDGLFEHALALSAPGIEKSQLLRDCIKATIQRQAARRLCALGGNPCR